MPDYFTPELYKKVKRNLATNLRVITSLRNNEGLKLRFDPRTGMFATERDGDARTNRNDAVTEEMRDSGSSKNMFEYPVLMTLYECRRLGVKVASGIQAGVGKAAYAGRLGDLGTPSAAFTDAVAGLTYLRDVTYSKGFKAFFLKGGRRDAITDILTKAEAMRRATTLPRLASLIGSFVRFLLPEDLKALVHRAWVDHDVRSVLSSGSFEERIAQVASVLYKKFYKSAEQGHGERIPSTRVKEYLAAVQRIAMGQNARIKWCQPSCTLPERDARSQAATLDDLDNGRAYVKGRSGQLVPASHGDICFIHFDGEGWNRPAARARVYIHLKADATGAHAREALAETFRVIRNPRNRINASVSSMKIAGLRELSRNADSLIVWTDSFESAQALVELLREPLARHAEDPLPALVKKVLPGIGVAAEPGISYDDGFDSPNRLNTRGFSFGTHRCALVARGMVLADDDTFVGMPSEEDCLCCVALTFAMHGSNALKPHKADAA